MASIVKSESFDTNNAWGFGGKSGTKTEYSNGVIKIRARNYHRHSGTSCANSVMFRYKGEELSVIGSSDVDFTELFIYENETGYIIAHVENKGVEFERNYHEYKLIDHVKIQP